ncbi:hypothetical protein LCGC14_2284080 [marine sediment metagenome]|uniref:Uncharacterized protein n=1 Tax=marine sediment metagenome TaxID=412755 RepID=A0A0F9FNE8_9ZZZZ
MNRLIMILGAAFWLGACDGSSPPPPEPCEGPPECVDWDREACECRDSPLPCELEPAICESGEVDLEACECVPVEPPPPNVPDPAEYINLDRVDDIINGTSSRNPGLLHGLTFGGWRDPLNVAAKCSDEVEYIGFSNAGALHDFGVFGMELALEGEDFIVPQLRKVNRRCKENHPQHDLRFCGRSEMRKSRLVKYRGTEEEPRLDAHLDRAAMARGLAGRCRAKLAANAGSPYDSIAGWCQSMKLAGFSKEDCPQ